MKLTAEPGYNRIMKTNLLKSFAVTLIAFLPLLGFLGVARIQAAPAVHGTTTSSASPKVERHTVTADLVDTATPAVQVLPELVVTAKAPVQKSWTMPKKAPKVWTCSAPRALVQGPIAMTVKDCEWR